MSVKTLEPGQSFAGYEIESCLGSGGMGSVYLARKGPKRVALKLCHFNDEQALARFEREALTLAQLGQVANIVPIHHYEARGEAPFLAMDYIAGEDLESRVRRQGPLDEDEALSLIATVSRSLHEVHRRGVVHRDIKPANILIREDGEPFLTDFGLSSNSHMESLTATGEVLGTPRCMAPEQLLATEVSPATDVWALGVTLYFCLSGDWPFRAESGIELAAQIINGKPALSSGHAEAWSKSTQALIRRALEKESADRFASALDFAMRCESPAQPSRSHSAPLLLMALCLCGLLSIPILRSRREAQRSELLSQLQEATRALDLERSDDDLLYECLFLKLRGPERELTESLSKIDERWLEFEGSGLPGPLSPELASRLAQAAIFEAQLPGHRTELARFLPKRWMVSSEGEGPGSLLALLDAALSSAKDGRFAEAQGRWRELIAAAPGVPEPEFFELWRCRSAPAFADSVFDEGANLSELESGLVTWFHKEAPTPSLASELNRVLGARFQGANVSAANGARALTRIDLLSRRWPILRPRVAARFHRALADASQGMDSAVVLYHKAQAALADRVAMLPVELDPFLLLSDLSVQRQVKNQKELLDGTAFLRLAAELASAGLMLPIESYVHWDVPKTPVGPPSPVFSERPWDHGYQLWAFIMSCRGLLTGPELKERRERLASLLERRELNELQRANARVFFCYARLNCGELVSRSEREAIAAELAELLDAPLPRPEDVCLGALSVHVDLFAAGASPALEEGARALHKRLREFVKERSSKQNFVERCQGRPAWAPLALWEIDAMNGRAFEGELMIYGNFAIREDQEDEVYRALQTHACRDSWLGPTVMACLVSKGHLKRAQGLMEALRASSVDSRDPGAYAAALNLLPPELQAKFRSP